VLMS